MANAVFTTSMNSIYDDRPEAHYHFPKTYLKAVESTVGDWIVYYEPRRDAGPSSSAGRMAYFAIARVARVEPDSARSGHYYAHVTDYLELDELISFRTGDRFVESSLMKPDGTTNKGAFGRAVRPIRRSEFELIVAMGFPRRREPWELADRVSDDVPDIQPRPIVEQVVSRRFRDDAFRRHVRSAYGNTCAISGLRLTNGMGRPEVEAAHIRPVESDGPDTVRNGLALTGTVHWMFDRGLISIDDSYRVIVSRSSVPAELASLVHAGRPIRLPERTELRPHPNYLGWHREHVFKS